MRHPGGLGVRALVEIAAAGIDEAFDAWDERPESTLAVAPWRRGCRQLLRRVMAPEA